jgi:tetratricopeptide (TPR) repeat protein
MNRIARLSAVSAWLGALALALTLAACSGESEEAAAEAERETRLAQLEQQKQELDAARQELADVEERLRQAQAGEPPAGEPTDAGALQSEITRRDAELTTQSEELNAALTNFINEVAQQTAIGPGEPLPAAMERAIALKAEEDMTLAREFITEGGDYARAIEMYAAILGYDPDNQRVKDAIAEAESMRYMDETRFARVENGMTPAQVEEALGPANLRNRRDYPDQGIVAWYYPKSERRDAAGVWFRKRGEGWEVYKTDFNAITREQAEG